VINIHFSDKSIYSYVLREPERKINHQSLRRILEKMKRLVVFAVLGVSCLSFLADSARAAGSTSRGITTRQQGNGGILAKLIELERRKNAALRQMFSGR
jgi:hypothetical protein